MKTDNMKLKVNVKFNEENPEPIEIIAQSILELAKAMKKLDSTRLKRDTLVILLSAHSKIGKTDINIILNNLADLENTFLKRQVNP